MIEPFEFLSKMVLSAQLRWFSPTCPCGGGPRPKCDRSSVRHFESPCSSPRVIEVTTSERTGIRLTNLTKSYGVVKAVRGINLTINPGETLALLGPNGAGKTTTIDMMLGLIRPDSGSVSLFGSTPTEAVDAGIISGM